MGWCITFISLVILFLKSHTNSLLWWSIWEGKLLYFFTILFFIYSISETWNRWKNSSTQWYFSHFFLDFFFYLQFHEQKFAPNFGKDVNWSPLIFFIFLRHFKYECYFQTIGKFESFFLTFRWGVFCTVFSTIQYYCILFYMSYIFPPFEVDKKKKKKPTRDSPVIAWNKTQGKRLGNNFSNIFNIDIQYIIHARKLNYCQDDNKNESTEKGRKSLKELWKKLKKNFLGQIFRVRGESLKLIGNMVTWSRSTYFKF